MRSGGLRVCAYWGQGEEQSVEVRLPQDIVADLTKCDELRNLRDQKRNEFLPAMKALLDSCEELPVWLRTQVESIERWRSFKKIRDLLCVWQDQKTFPGDLALYELLRDFCYRDHHLWAWEDCQRKKAMRHRLEEYRKLGADLAERYDTLVVEDFDLRRVATKKSMEDGDEDTYESARHNRVLACTSELRGALVNAFVAHGGMAYAVSAVNTTMECHVNREVEPFDAAKELRHTTSKWIEWDQDDNAARNIVNRYCEQPGDAKILGGARRDKITGKVVEMSGGRYRRAKAAKVAAGKKIDAARNTAYNPSE
jgi:hypothetical protein